MLDATPTTDNTMEQRGGSKKDDLNNRSIKVYLHKGLDIIIPEQSHGEDKVLCIFAQLHCAQLGKKNPLYKYLTQKRQYYSRISNYHYTTPNSSSFHTCR
jgi:hypothetical protein